MTDLITLTEAKSYLRVDYTDEDALIGSLLQSAQVLCKDVARLTDEGWEELVTAQGSAIAPLRVAVLYTLGYLYEHREEADHHDLMLTLRSLLSFMREGIL